MQDFGDDMQDSARIILAQLSRMVKIKRQTKNRKIMKQPRPKPNKIKSHVGAVKFNATKESNRQASIGMPTVVKPSTKTQVIKKLSAQPQHERHLVSKVISS